MDNKIEQAKYSFSTGYRRNKGLHRTECISKVKLKKDFKLRVTTKMGGMDRG